MWPFKRRKAESEKQVFRLRADQIRPLAMGLGGCTASHMITCGGHKVGFMYREEPSHEHDSGWRFMSGRESDEYMQEPDNFAIHDVNTIANYDAEIVPFLHAPVGAAFERQNGTGAFVEVRDFEAAG